MRCKAIRPLVYAVASALGIASLASCGENTPPAGAGGSASADNHLAADPGPAPQLPSPPGEPQAAQAAPRAPGNAGSAPGAPGAAPAANAASPAAFSDAPVPPRDAQWTLLAYSERSETHVQDVNRLKQDLVQKTGRRGWYAIHGREESNLYFGFYRSVEDLGDPATAVAKADLQFVRSLELRDTNGQSMKPFESAGFYPLAAPDPTAPPEWNLFNMDLAKRPKDPTRAYWSLQIMAFKSNPLRKQAAVQAVAALRKQGVEAYYFHGETVSSVCVGAWPMDAVEQQENHGDHTIADPESTLFVLPSESLRGKQQPDHDDQGHKVVTVAPVVHIIDKGMKAMMDKYYFHAVNYTVHGVTGTDGVFHEDPSFLVVVPRAKGNGFYDSSELSPSDLAAGAAGDGGSGSTFFGSHSPGTPGTLGAAGSAGSAGSVGLPSRVAPGAAGVYGAQLPPPAPSEAPAPGVGHLRHLGE